MSVREEGIDLTGPIAERFWAKTMPEPNSGCLIWIGARSHGYGYLGIPGTRMIMGAHRLAVLLAGREIPEGYEPDHRCRIRCCVEERHLDVVTHQTNTLRTPDNAIYARRNSTHCPKGHPYDMIDSQGWRRCHQCFRRLANTARRRRRGSLSRVD